VLDHITVRRHRRAPGAEPNGVRGIYRLQDRVALLALRAVTQTHDFFVRGFVIGGESNSSRASPVVNQTAVFWTLGSSRLPERFTLPLE
jgi:hypothetical protein